MGTSQSAICHMSLTLCSWMRDFVKFETYVSHLYDDVRIKHFIKSDQCNKINIEKYYKGQNGEFFFKTSKMIFQDFICYFDNDVEINDAK